MPTNRRGSALLAVLWLSAALAAIAFSLANTVRGETERTSVAVDGLRAYYLATAAVQRTLNYMEWAALFPAKRFYSPDSPVLRLSFPDGEAAVEVIPETARLNINTSQPENLFRLIAALGVPPEAARALTTAIVDWRTPAAGGTSPFDGYYLSLSPSFRARHASFEEIEELLLVRGMTPELFYGTYDRAPEGQAGPRLIPRGGLRECVSAHGATDQFDVNTAAPAVLAAAGVPPDVIAAIVRQRRLAPLTRQQVSGLAGGGPWAGKLRVGGNSMFTLRATARLRLGNGNLSDLRRSVGALVKLKPKNSDAPYHILRWYDTMWSAADPLI
jgi:general secretion pathway protein K